MGCRLCQNYVLQCIKISALYFTSLAQLLPPRSPTVSNPPLDSSLCRAAAPRLRPLAPRLCPLQLLLAACVRFESAAAPWLDCIYPLHLLLVLPVCVRFQLLLLDCARFSCCCMLAACVGFSCCSRSRPLRLLLPIASASPAAPRYCVRFDCCSPHPLAAPAGFQPNVLEHSSRSSKVSK